MIQTIEDEIVRKGLIHIKPFLKNKRAGSEAKKACETIITYLIERAANMGETEGWVMATDVWQECERQNIHTTTMDRCLVDLAVAHIIDKTEYLYPAKRRRPGPAKKKKNVFYRVCLGYFREWGKTREELIGDYNKLLGNFVKVAEKMNIAIWLLENLKKTSTPADFDAAVKATERFMGIKKHANTTEPAPNEIIKSMAAEWGENRQEYQKQFDQPIPTTEDRLKSILDARPLYKKKN